MVWPDAPWVNTGLGCRFTVKLGTGPSNSTTKRSKPLSWVTRTPVTWTVPGAPPLTSVQENTWVLSPGGVGGVTGAGEITGPDLPAEAGPCEIAAVGAEAVLHAVSNATSPTTAAARTD